MLEEIKRKEVDKRDKQLPQSFEQLIQMYDLNRIWLYFKEIIVNSNIIETKVNSIIEQGSNTSAKYIKFEDGTLIQYGKVTLQSYDSRSSGGLTYWSNDDTVTLPYNFIDTNFIVTTNIHLANMNIFCQSYGVATNTDKVRISFIATQNEESRDIHFICIGRWK